MKKHALWQPSKFVFEKEYLTASRDPAVVNVRSRLITTLVARAYHSMLLKHASGTIADIGCGRAPLYIAYRSLVNETICVDWATSANRNEFIDIEADLNFGIPLANDSVDTLLATDVLEHLRNPHLFWQEVVRVLRPGGKFLLGVPFLYRIHEAPHDYFRFTRFRLHSYCEENNLTLITLEEYGGAICVLADTVAKAIKPLIAAKVVQWCALKALNFPWVKSADKRSSRLAPLGYCLVAQKPTE